MAILVTDENGCQREDHAILQLCFFQGCNTFCPKMLNLAHTKKNVSIDTTETKQKQKPAKSGTDQVW